MVYLIKLLVPVTGCHQAGWLLMSAVTASVLVIVLTLTGGTRAICPPAACKED